MENGKKKLKLSISGSSKKTFSSIEEAKSKSKNTVVIEKKAQSFQENLNFLNKVIIILDQVIPFLLNQTISPGHQYNLLQILRKGN